MQETKELIRGRIESALRELAVEPGTIEFTDPPEREIDLSTNVALMHAKEAGMKPRELAEALAEKIERGDELERIEVAGPGFLNFTLQPTYLAGQLPRVLDPGFGRPAATKEKVDVEYISANPTGPLTMGNARGGYVGDVISNVLGWSGRAVTREYYFNDAGTQVRKLIESVKIVGGVASGDAEYQGAYVEELAKEFAGELRSRDDEQLGVHLTEAIFERYIKGAIGRLGIGFDAWFNEKTLMGEPSKRALARLQEAGLVYEKDGATWLKSTVLGDERDRVIKKSNGDPTYLGNDIPYHLNIFEERGFDRGIKVWGADHAGQIPSLRLTMKRLCPEKELEFVVVQWVRLMKDGKEYKMSKRAGTYVTTDELLKEIGGDHPAEVARWFFISRSHDTHMDFDLDLARDRSEKNPVFYVQYAYARIHGILRNVESGMRNVESGRGESGSKIPNSKFDIPHSSLAEPEELRLIRRLLEFPEVVAEVATGPEYPVHRLTFYAQDLAADFHKFYHEHRVLEAANEELVAARLELVRATEKALKTLLEELIGVRAPESM